MSEQFCYYCMHYARFQDGATRGVCCLTDSRVYAVDTCECFKARPQWIKMRRVEHERYFKPARCD